MTKHVLSRLTAPANLPRLVVGLTVAAGAMVTGAPAFAADAHQAQAPVQAEVQAQAPVRAEPSQPKVVAAPRQKSNVSPQALLRVAESQVGVKENAAGGGTPFHRWYMSSQRAKETVARDGGSIRAYANAPWCAMFVSWVGEKTGLRPTVGWDAYTVTYAKWFKANKRWGGATKPGAVVFFSWNGGGISSIDHVGLVKKDNGDGTITTIEGNTGNGEVEQRVRPKAHVVGYGYPVYQG